MIQMYTYMDVADNTGAKEVMCIQVLGGNKRRVAYLGDVIKASVKKAPSRTLSNLEGAVAGSDVPVTPAKAEEKK